jgi:glycosyltransferase involved in cell wall biosynthesis
MKLLHVISSINPASGGPIEGIIQQNATMLRFGVTREAVTLDVPEAPYLKKIPFAVYALGVTPGVGQTKRLISRYGYSPKLIPWLLENANKYDCIIVNGIWNYAAFSASVAFRYLKPRYFVFTHGMLDPWFRVNYPFKHIFKQISWLFVEGPLLKHARAVLFTSEDELQFAHNAYWGYRGYHERVVGYGIAAPPALSPDQISAFRSMVPALGGRPYLFFLSRIHPKKGCDILINAFACVAHENSDIDLVVAGPDQVGWRQELENLAAKLGMTGRIHWPGMLLGDAKWGGYRGAEAFLLPSHSENFGIVVAEAMACGAPVITTNKVNIWREVEGSGGGLVAADNEADFALALKAFLNMSAAEKAEMRVKAVAGYRDYFDLDAKAAQLLKLLKRSKMES